MRTLFLLFCLVTFISCSEDFRKITAISEISGLWEGEKGSLLIDTDEMTIRYKDSTVVVLTSRSYDRSKITVSSGSIMFFDAHVYINRVGSTIKIDKINKKESSLYFKE